MHRLDRIHRLIVVAKHDLPRPTTPVQATNRCQDLCCPRCGSRAPIARDPRNRQRMAVVASGKPASTRWSVVRRYRDRAGGWFTLIDISLLTGRTHQIRVHMAWLGYPLAGDALYGKASDLVPRLVSPRPRTCSSTPSPVSPSGSLRHCHVTWRRSWRYLRLRGELEGFRQNLLRLTKRSGSGMLHP